MILHELARAGLDDIRGHKLRSALTLLGIILGTLSITVMLAFLGGVVGAVREAYQDYFREDIVRVDHRYPRDVREAARFRRSPGLQPQDARAIAERVPGVAAAAAYLDHEGTVRAGSREAQPWVNGVTSSASEVYAARLESGRSITVLDEISFARVCVLSHDLRKELFGAADPLGLTVTLDGRPFRVIGVERRRGNDLVDELFYRPDWQILTVPLSTLRKVFLGNRGPVSSVVVRLVDPARAQEQAAEIESFLARAHRGVRDVEVITAAEHGRWGRTRIESLIRSWILVLGSVAVVSLVVGGLGLMSVMLIAIHERLHEIGLRKAVGATDGDLFAQFLCESAALAFAGGCLGVLAGVGLTQAVAGYFKAGLPLSVPALAAAVGIAVLIGALYGIYPALKASRLAPVEALRAAGR
jgi:putative ABC transport system permease protein